MLSHARSQNLLSVDFNEHSMSGLVPFSLEVDKKLRCGVKVHEHDGAVMKAFQELLLNKVLSGEIEEWDDAEPMVMRSGGPIFGQKIHKTGNTCPFEFWKRDIMPSLAKIMRMESRGERESVNESHRRAYRQYLENLSSATNSNSRNSSSTSTISTNNNEANSSTTAMI
jgi:hypothetical protein